MESVWRRIAPDVYFKVSVAMAKGAERLGRWRTGSDKNRCFRASKVDWQEGDQFHVRFFLVRSTKGWVLRPCKLLVGTPETPELVRVSWDLALACVLCPCC